MRRRGYTLVEVAMALGVAGLLLYALVALLTSGSRLFAKGVGASRGPEGALVIMDMLERDLFQCLQMPGDPRPPVALGPGGSELALYVARPLAEGATRVVGEPVLWGLEPVAGQGGLFHPRRNDRVLRSVVLSGLEFELLEPDADEHRRGWTMVVRLKVNAESRLTKDFLMARLVHLAQPSSNFLHFPDHGEDLLPGRVFLLPPPDGRPLFRALGPPEVAP